MDQEVRSALGGMATSAGVFVIGVALQVIAAANQPPPGKLPSGPGSFADLISAAGGAALFIGGLLFVYALFKLGRALSRPSRPGEPD